MEKVKQHKRLFTFVCALLALAIIMVGLYWQTMPRSLYTQSSPSPSPASAPSSSSPTPTSTPSSSAPSSPSTSPTLLVPQEIREYQSEDLSPISDFRENSIMGPQYINASTYRLTIKGLVNKTVVYTYDEVINKFQKYKKVVTLYCVEGWSVKILWEGFLVKDLLQEAGVDNKTQMVIFRACDGYSTSLPLDYIASKDILIAYKMNDVVLPPERGFPFELVAESKYGYKWIKWITEIELSDNVDYTGYWESRGYPNGADLPPNLP